MGDNKKCIKDVLVKELDDLKIRARLIEEAYLEDTIECNEKIEAIDIKCKEIEMAILEESKKLNKKYNCSYDIMTFFSCISVMLISEFLISYGISNIMSIIISMTGILGLDAVYVYKKRSKSKKLIDLYEKELKLLSKDKSDYEKIKTKVRSEYIASCNLVIEKERDIARIDDIGIVSEVIDNIDLITYDKPYVRKLEKN